MVKIKGNIPQVIPQPPANAGPAAAETPAKLKKSDKAGTPDAPAANAVSQAAREDMQREWKRLRDLPHKQILSGAASLFSGVFFPANLLNVNDPKNDPKYMRLLAAVLGLDDLNNYFYTGGSAQDEEEKEDASTDEQNQGDEKPKKKHKLK